MAADGFFLGIDVGTGSARAGIFDPRGRMLAHASHPIRLWRPAPDFAEQSSADIWRAVCSAVRQALIDARLTGERIAGIGFDATCSLVVLDERGAPVTVSPTGNDDQNIIVWMDHRAIRQAERINRAGHEVLRYVGGEISPEMQSPKLLWLKEHLPESFRRAAHFFDLPDFLTWRATGDDTRSLCSTVCKWTYVGHQQAATGDELGAWDDSYWNSIGLGEFPAEGYRRIGHRIRPMGEPVGNGLTEDAARELGLRPGTPVGVSIIDAHAGGLGVIGTAVGGKAPTRQDMERRLALIGGTSSCHMAVSREAQFVGGIWGPYYSAMVPGMWLTEGGQSATGALIDHVIFSHARGAELRARAEDSGTTVYDLLNERLDRLAAGVPHPSHLTRELHVLPYFHGNRSPRADPTLRGVIAGLRLDDSIDALALLYLATIQAIAYGTRHIIEEMNRGEYDIQLILACGGGTKNAVFLREHADITGCEVVLPAEPEAVLLGSALLGAVAAGRFADIPEAMAAMNQPGLAVHPNPAARNYHHAKYLVFRRLYDDQMAWRKLMKEAEDE